MRIITCYKLVPDEQDIRVNPDRTLSFDRTPWKIGLYDLNAVEAGMQLAEASDGSVAALSVGGAILENSKLKKAILSRGPNELFMVSDAELEEADTFEIASTLAAAIKKMGDFDLILCGEGSTDLYAGQVGAQLGQLLGLPTLNSVFKITPGDSHVQVERELEDVLETCEVSLPAVLSVTSDINVPRIPSMKEILAAGKKPVTQWTAADTVEGDPPATAPKTRIVSTLAPDQVERKQAILEGDAAVDEVFSQIVNS